MFVCHEPSLVALALMSFLWLSGRASGQVTTVEGYGFDSCWEHSGFFLTSCLCNRLKKISFSTIKFASTHVNDTHL